MGRRPVAAERVLRYLAEAVGEEHYGLELMGATGLPSGSIYPALRLLEVRGWISSRWEAVDPADVGRSARRLYRLTPDGLKAIPALDAAGEPWFASRVPVPQGVFRWA